MYDKIYNKDGSLKHSQECKMVFGKKDTNCPRCIELINGASSRNGWQKNYFELKKINNSHKSDCNHKGEYQNICTCGT